MGLQQFEQRLERLVEGAFSKTFRGDLQPVEIARRLTREMDLHRRVGVRGLIAPNVFVVTCRRDDVERFETSSTPSSRELAEAAREHARAGGLLFVGPVERDDLRGPGSGPAGSTSRGRGRTRARRDPGRARRSARRVPGRLGASRS